MKKCLRITAMLAVASMIMMLFGCNKGEEGGFTTATSGSKAARDESFRMGEKLNNPYTVENMLIAQDSLLAIGQLKEPINIYATHLYVQLFPSDSSDMNRILADTTLHLFPYPLDYEIEGEGSFEVQEGETPEVYTVVPVGYDFPVDYKVIDECFIPAENHGNPDLETLEIGSFIRTGNTTEEELKELFASKALWRYPKGYVRVYNTETYQNEGVRGVRVYTRRFVRIGSAYTNSFGYYSINRGYLWNPHYAVVFENSNGFKIWGNIGPLTPAIYNVGKHSRSGYNITIGRASQAWPWATINNAALLYRTYLAPHFGVTNTPSGLRIWYINKTSDLGNASAPMLRHVAGYTSVQVSKWLQIFGVSQDVSMIVGGALYCILRLCPDILVMKNSATSTKQLQSTVFHEMAHASHYSKVGSAYWLKYIEQICLNMGYGDSYDGSNGIIGVGEMWGVYFGHKCLNEHYNTNLPYTYIHWFRPQILMNIDDQLAEIGPHQINYVMGNSVVDHDGFKNELINQWGYGDVITLCFSVHGF